MTSRRIIFVGGGSLGHVMPGVAVCDAMRAISPDVQPLFLCAPREEETAYLHSRGLRFMTVHAGKFPRGLSMRWITFPILFVVSFIQSLGIIGREAPGAVFSKGGFVSVPVCLAARIKGVPIVLHESDSVMGMANGVIAVIAARVCVGFPQEAGRSERVEGSTQASPSVHATTRYPLPATRLIFTGNPVRPEILQGSRQEGLRITGFSGNKPVIMVTGGSQGSVALNDAVRSNIDALLQTGDVMHLTGKNKEGAQERDGYWKAESVFEELPHLYAVADIVVTRCGAGAISELAALHKTAVVVPLRGVAGDHQWKNAQSLTKAGAIILLPQEDLVTLPMVINSLATDFAKRKALGDALHAFFPDDAAAKIAGAVLDVLRA